MTEGRLTLSLKAEGLPSAGIYATELINTATGHVATVALTPLTPRTVVLPEGMYIVRSALPSGELLTATAVVTARAQAQVTVEPRTGVVPHMKGGGGLPVPIWLRLWDERPRPWPGAAEARPDGIDRVELRLRPGPGLHVLQVGGRAVAWRLVRLPPADTCRITLDRVAGEGGFDDGVRVRAWDTDPGVESVLRYLAAGQPARAQVLAEEFGVAGRRGTADTADRAAVAGYLLLRSRGTAGLGWAARAADRFSWLPDVHVVHAWLLLRERGASLRRAAREVLLRAQRTGIPHYTEGLRLLFDGLRRMAVADPGDERVAVAAGEVGRYAEACDWDAPQTTYWGAEPAQPSLARRVGGVPDTQPPPVVVRVGR